MKLEKKRVLVVGAGKSGLSCAKFLKERGAVVTVNDIKSDLDLASEAEYLKSYDIPCVFGSHPRELFLEQDLIVVSPGVPHQGEPFSEAREKGVEIIGEMELAFRFISTPIVAITGTNGKTTTTTLVGEILRDGNIPVFVGGNIGTPLIEYANDDSKSIVVLEVSSFQLETVKHFHPFGGIILNITPDHLDRYNDMEDYAETKMRLFEHQESYDFGVLNADDEWIMRYKPGILAEIFLFSTKKAVNKGSYLDRNDIHIIHPSLSQKEVIKQEDIGLKGIHNMENVMAAIITGLELGVPFENIKTTLKRFKGLSHRLEFVEEINGVNFYDDSKGTNVGAVEKALECFNTPVILILGGKEKGAGYSYLEEEVSRVVKAVIAIGEAKDRIFNDLNKIKDVIKAETLEEAVLKSYEMAEKGDNVLLSPACSSFDMFKSYAERGEKFSEAVRKLKGEIVGKNR